MLPENVFAHPPIPFGLRPSGMGGQSRMYLTLDNCKLSLINPQQRGERMMIWTQKTPKRTVTSFVTSGRTNYAEKYN